MPSPNAANVSSNASHGNAREAAKPARAAGSDVDTLADQIDSIRAEIGSLTKTLGDVAARQWGDAQATAQDSIRRNPLAAVAIAAGFGFLYALIRR